MSLSLLMATWRRDDKNGGVSNEQEKRRARATERRRTLIGEVVSLQEDRPPMGATIQERLEILAEVSKRAWALTGQPIPTWTRGQIPRRVVRSTEA